MQVVKIIGGGALALALMSIRWVAVGWSTRAMRVARVRGLSLYRVPPPYDRWGIDARCDRWTIYGGCVGAVTGAGLGAMVSSWLLGGLFAAAGAVAGGWYYRVVTALLAIDRDAPVASRSARPRWRMRSRLSGALTGAACGVMVVLVVGPSFDQHGPTLVAETVLGAAYLAWQLEKRARD
jgi:hypothetical protein